MIAVPVHDRSTPSALIGRRLLTMGSVVAGNVTSECAA